MVHVPLHVARGIDVLTVEQRAPPHATHHWRTHLILLALRLAEWLARQIPRQRAEWVCRRAGDVWCLAAPRQRRAVRRNLTQILGRSPHPRQVRATFQNGALNYWDTLLIPYLGHDAVHGIVDTQGTEHLAAALALGKGAVVGTSHLGSISFAGQVVGAYGYRAIAVMEAIDPPELCEFFAQHRSTEWVRVVPLGPQTARLLLRTLKQNQIVGLVSDREVSGHGVEVEFFGRATRFPDGAAVLSLRTGAPLLTGFAIRRRDGRLDGIFEPPLEIEKTGETREDVWRLTQELARRFEYHIARHPEQWTVFQERWPN